VNLTGRVCETTGGDICIGDIVRIELMDY
jgi:hypothetical protein